MAATRAGRRQSSAPRRLAGLVQASHPYPIAMVVGLTALTGLASSPGGVDEGRLGLATVAMLCSQLAIGWTNDYHDREHDARFQPHKPLPSGLVQPALLPPLVATALGAAAAQGAVLGAPAMALLVAGTACGMAYNFVLKQTRLSWLAYAAAFALLPPYVWAALDLFEARFAWLYAVGAPLAVGAHIANALPDVESDQAAGAGGFVPWLGKRRALVALAACGLVSLAVVAVTWFWLDYAGAILGGAIGIYAVLLLAATWAYRGQPFPGAASRGFRLVAPAFVILAAGWLAAIARA